MCKCEKYGVFHNTTDKQKDRIRNMIKVKQLTERHPVAKWSVCVVERLSARHLILQQALGQCIYIIFVYLSVTLFYACAGGAGGRVKLRIGLVDGRRSRIGG